MIEVEGLSKRYVISGGRGPGYRTLRESLAEQAANLARTLSGAPRSGSRDFWALKDVSFSLKEGDRLGIIGRNGAGKSTLLKILSRITEPTSGCVRLAGRVASLLEVGTGFHPELTGRENIFLNGALLGMSRQEMRARFDEIVAFSEVEEFLDVPVKRYSSGMYMKLAFSVAAHLDPEILIVDEVLAVGDARFQKKCLTKMKDSSAAGRTVLFVSHNLGSIRQICDKGLLLDKGRGQGVRPIGEVITAYNQLHAEHFGQRVMAEGIEFGEFFVNDQDAGQPIQAFSNDPINVSLDYRAAAAGRDLCVSFGLRSNVVDSFILYSHNHLEGVVHKTASEGRIQAQFPAIALSPGTYTLEMQAWLDGKLVVPENAVAEVLVQPVPFFGSNTTHTSFPALVLSRVNWSFR